MRVKDFESARREDMKFERMNMRNCGVLSVCGSVHGDDGEAIHGIWSDCGKFYAFMQQPGNDDTNLVIGHAAAAAGVYASWNGKTLVRTPWFDLKFE